MIRPEWIYDGSDLPDPHGKGAQAVRFLKLLKHPKSTAGGNAFQLPNFMERVVLRVYGDTDESGQRKVKTVFEMVPRGNRKTAFGAGLALLHTIGPERMNGGQVVSAAVDRKQARIAFEEATGIINIDARLRSVTRVRDAVNRIQHNSSGAVYEAISAEAGGQHGRTPSFVLADELHAWKGNQLWDVLRTGVTKTRGSLLWIITTAGAGQNNIAYELYSYAKKVQLGEIDDPGFLPIIWEAAAKADWRDEKVWHAVNPGLEHGFPDLDGLRQLAREAEERPAQREAFKQLHLNMWLDHSHSPFVEMAVYDDGDVTVDEEALRHKPCWLGVDLSSTSDLTAIVAAIPDDEEGYDVLAWFFCPEANLRRRAEVDKVPYPLWVEAGFITPTPGNVVDYRVVEQTIRDICERFDVREIAFDPHLAQVMMANLADDGYPAVAMRQGWVTMAPAIKELERAVIARRFRHGGNPVLRWHFANVAIETDKAGNKSMHKGKSRDRIDGAVAAAMAVGRASASNRGPSVYETEERPHGLLVI